MQLPIVVPTKESLDISNIENEILRQSNKIVMGLFDLTLAEFQVVCTALLLVSQKNEKRDHFDSNTVFTITVDDMKAVWGEAGEDASSIYKQLRKTAISIQTKNLKYWSYDKNSGEKKLNHSSWFAYVTEPKPENKVSCRYIDFGFPSPLIPILRDCNEQFTWNFICEIKGLKKSFYAIRLYFLLSKSKNYSHNIRLEVDNLKNMFQIGDKYSKMTDFRKYVIEKSIELINKHTRLNVKVTPEKKGKNIVAFIFETQFHQNDLDYRRAVGKGTPVLNKQQKVGIPSEFKLTESQISKFLPLMMKQHDFGNRFAKVGELEREFMSRVKDDLMRPGASEKYREVLEEVGFTFHSRELS